MTASTLPEGNRGWQPIGTAPHNKIVLLFAVTDRDGETGPVRNWKMETGFWSRASGWHWPNRLSGRVASPTHWQPLPEPPQ